MDPKSLERGEQLKAAIENAKSDWKANRDESIALLEKFCTDFANYIGHVSAVEYKVGAQKPANWETAKTLLARSHGDVAVEMQLHDFCGLKFNVAEEISVSIEKGKATISAFDQKKTGTSGTDFEADLPKFFDQIIKGLPERYLLKEPSKPRASVPPTGSRAKSF